jgi:AraC-like DNA-binding protein
VREERLAESVLLAELASVAGSSVSQFSRQFEARTGLAPQRFLLGPRIGQACRLQRRDRASRSPEADWRSAGLPELRRYPGAAAGVADSCRS